MQDINNVIRMLVCVCVCESVCVFAYVWTFIQCFKEGPISDVRGQCTCVLVVKVVVGGRVFSLCGFAFYVDWCLSVTLSLPRKYYFIKGHPPVPPRVCHNTIIDSS